MRFGLFTSMGNQTWAGVLDLWRHLEATGWDAACVTDHFMPNNPQREGSTLESWTTVAPYLKDLPERERRVLYLRFFEDRTQAEIAADLGISQMHVSRVLSTTLELLRKRIGETAG